MPVSVTTDNIILTTCPYKGSNQVIINGTIYVPDYKPDIQRVLSLQGRAEVSEATPSEGNVTVDINVPVTLLYQGKDGENPLYVLNETLTGQENLSTPGITPDMQISAQAQMSFIEYRLLDSRSVEVNAVINIFLSGCKEETTQIVTDAEGAEVKKNTINYTGNLQRKTEQITLSDTITLPAGQPNIRELLEWDLDICENEVRALDGRVLIRGTICFSGLYIGEDDTGSLEIIEAELPFSGEAQLSNVTENSNIEPILTLTDVEVLVQPDSDGEDRSLNVSMRILADISARQEKILQFVEDAYIPNQEVLLETAELTLPVSVSSARAIVPIREETSLELKYPDVMKIIKAWSKINISDVKTTKDKVTAEGDIQSNVLYVAKSDYNPINVFSFKSPFYHEIEVKGAEEGMDAAVKASVSNTTVDMLSERDLSLRTTAQMDVNLNSTNVVPIVTEITLPGDPKLFSPVASIIIYTVQPGDSLWTIAKRFNTTIDDIDKINNIDDLDSILPGQRILILRRFN